jgi:putative SOS response-associated peptidase YedK
MCYDVSSGLKAALKYAKKRHDDPLVIADLEKRLELWLEESKAHYHVSGFEHPKLLVFTNENPLEPQSYSWGLIPSWTKDLSAAKIIQNQTLNARSESMFEKPAFRGAAKQRRCLIYLDGFFEHHHQKGKTYPFYIQNKDNSPLIIAGLWEHWTDKSTGEIFHTMSMVTTSGNELMAKIHNNPKLNRPRMPLILSEENQDVWLSKEVLSEEDQLKISALCIPSPSVLLRQHAVSRLRGKESLGDTKEALLELKYKDLPDLFQ